MKKFFSGEEFLDFIFRILIVGHHFFELRCDFLSMRVALSICLSRLLLIGLCVCLMIPGFEVNFFEI
jgi:hypothetical protein